MALQGKTNEEKIWNYLRKKGINDFGVAGLMGNIYAESGLSPTNVQNSYEKKLGYSDAEYTKTVDNGTYKNFVKDAAGYGLCQWTYYTRKQALLNFAKSNSKSIGDLEMQLDFLYKELSESYSSLLSSLKSATSVLKASNDVLTKFEKPADQSVSVQTKRASYGQRYYDKYHSNSDPDIKGGNSNMANTVDKVIAIAEAEVGYLEKKNNSQLDSKTANAGSANYTKYGRDMHKIYPAVMDFPAAWCDCFVDWCFQKAYGVSNAKKLLAGQFDDYTVNSAQLYKNKKAWYTSNPKVGDQIFFKNANGGICHTGLVYKVDSTYVYTIEGNTSSSAGVVANGGCVAYKKYTLNYSRIAGYGRPKYDKATAKKDTSNKAKKTKTKKSTTKTVASAEDFAKSLAGTYTVTASDGLNLRYNPGKLTADNVVTVIPSGKKVQCYGYYTSVSGVKWYLVTYGKKTGFVSCKYLKKC